MISDETNVANTYRSHWPVAFRPLHYGGRYGTFTNPQLPIKVEITAAAVSRKAALVDQLGNNSWR